jgi:ComF family protein
MKYGQQTYLAKGIAGFMLNQWAQLQWPVPDIIIPVPQSTSHWLERGFNQSGLIAKQFAKGIDKTFAEPIKRNSGDYSQAGLKKDQRKKLTNVRFSLHKPELLTDKTVLLIDDVSTTGATLKQCGSIIVQAGPRALYALTFCKA